MDRHTLLLAEDQDELREITREVLELNGFRVLEAHDGVHAVELFRQHGDEIRLGVFDVDMPRLSGPEAALQIMQSEPLMPFVFVTGFDGRVEFSPELRHRDYPVLRKPVIVSQLVETIGELLVGH